MGNAVAALALVATGSEVVATRKFAGGDISGATLLTLANGNHCVAKTGPMVPVEARMLQTMGQSEAPVPGVIACEGEAMLMEYLPSTGSLSGTAWLSLAEALNALHRCHSAHYGWSENYALSQVAVENEPAGNWPDFWAERRLLCHLAQIDPQIGRRIERLCSKLGELLPSDPTPCLLHGDLWGGNVLVDGTRVTGLIDPNAYFGDREVDVASITVFDAPSQAFFDALGLDPGWESRLPVYRLWMWLVHVRLFGGSYKAAVERELYSLGF